MDTNAAAKRDELERLKAQVAQLEGELAGPAPQRWRPSGFYAAYYATTGFMLGIFGAATSLLFNVVGAVAFGEHPLKLIQVYLTFPFGEQALDPKQLTQEYGGAGAGMILAIGVCLYLGTGMLLGIPMQLGLALLGGKNLAQRFAVATLLGAALWLINFYGVLSWLQPLLFGGDESLIVKHIPWWVALLTHLVFAWTQAVVYPWGLYAPTWSQVEKS